MSSYLDSAFALECPESSPLDPHYVALVSTYRAYGGPEEGGWWYDASCVEKWQLFANRRDAELVAERIQATADELGRMAMREHGDYCLRSMEWLEARGLDADYLPEPDGPTKYRVIVCDTLPMYSTSRPTWE